MGQSMGNTPPMPAGIRPIPQGTSVPDLNPIPFLQGLNPLANTPLIGGAAQGRGPRQEPQTPATQTLPSGTPMVGFDSYPTVRQPTVPPIDKSSQFATSGPRSATPDDIDFFYGRGKYTNNQRASPTPPQVAQPAVKPASPYSNKVPIQTPYGTIYATPEQASRQRVAEIATMPRDAARLAGIGEEARRSARIKQVRANTRETLRRRELERQETYNISQNKKREEREAAARQRAINEIDRPSRAESNRRARRERPNTTQRSWSNYSGDNPIKRRRGTDFYEDSPYGGYA